MRLLRKRSNIYVITVLGEEKEGGAVKVLEELMAENFSNWARDINLQS